MCEIGTHFILIENSIHTLRRPQLYETSCDILDKSKVLWICSELFYRNSLWFKHILFRRKGLGAAYNATTPSPERYSLCSMFIVTLLSSQMMPEPVEASPSSFLDNNTCICCKFQASNPSQPMQIQQTTHKTLGTYIQQTETLH